MYVWSDGQNHRITVVGGLAFCQAFEVPNVDRSRRALLLGEMAGSARKMIERGIRPLGLILDLRRVTPIDDEPGRAALANLMRCFRGAGLPVGVLLRDAEKDPSGYLPKEEESGARLFSSLPAAESWVRSGNGAQQRVNSPAS